ncbi:MAG: aldo/keto reductase [Firmicutes bacterium]|nr:aldo/keto reductase [Bacillota bacterium]
MEKRYAKKMKQELGVLGFGGWQLGNTEFWGEMDFVSGVTLVKEAFENGINFFDTAPGYASGNSERIIGEAVKEFRDQVVINTKFGHNADGTSNFNVDYIEHAIDMSLERLQTDYIDSVILHNPEFYILQGETDHFVELKRLKDIGKIRGYGASIDTYPELLATIRNLDVDVIEIMFNLVHQDIIPLLEEVEEKGIMLVIKVPLDSGWLSGKYNENSIFTGIRARWDRKTIENRADIIRRIKDIVNEDNLVPTALSFLLSFPAVTTVIVGVKNQEQLHSNISAIKNELDPETKQKLMDLYQNYIVNIDTPW